jgi:hypothetical protein
MQTNMTIFDNMTLTGLTEGPHNLTVYAKDTAGNIEKSSTVFFFIDTTEHSPSHSPSIPEFPLWVVPPLLTAASAFLFFRRKHVK